MDLHSIFRLFATIATQRTVFGTLVAAAISAETKVLSYGVACNSCAHCSTMDNKLRDSEIHPEEYETKMAIHKPVCSAEYSDYSSVQLESAMALKVIRDALARGVIFSAIVSDGDKDSLRSSKGWDQ